MRITGQFHSARSCIPSPDPPQVFSLGLTPNGRGSTPFNSSVQPITPSYQPRPFYRGGGRSAANFRLRQPFVPSPQARHAASLAAQHPTPLPQQECSMPSQSAYVAEEHYDQWNYAEDPDYQAFMAAHEDAAHEAYVASIEVDPLEAAYHAAPLSGVKRGLDDDHN